MVLLQINVQVSDRFLNVIRIQLSLITSMTLLNSSNNFNNTRYFIMPGINLLEWAIGLFLCLYKLPRPSIIILLAMKKLSQTLAKDWHHQLKFLLCRYARGNAFPFRCRHDNLLTIGCDICIYFVHMC